jgi:protein involved in polysaccharide export with SLBB domain
VRLVSRSLRMLAVVGTVVGALLSAPSAARSQATVQPGDRIVFRLWQVEAVRDTLDVDGAGNVVFPIAGVMRVGGSPVASLRDSVQARLSTFVETRSGGVTVDVAVLKPVTVVGSVREASVFYVNSTTTVRDVVAMAKGIDEFGDRKKVSLLRGGQSTLLLDWDQPSSRVELQSGDAVVVGRRSWLALNGVQLGSLGLGLLSIVISLSK